MEYLKDKMPKRPNAKSMNVSNEMDVKLNFCIQDISSIRHFDHETFCSLHIPFSMKFRLLEIFALDIVSRTVQIRPPHVQVLKRDFPWLKMVFPTPTLTSESSCIDTQAASASRRAPSASDFAAGTPGASFNLLCCFRKASQSLKGSSTIVNSKSNSVFASAAWNFSD